MSKKIKDTVYNCVIALHRRTGKEWISLKEIYEEVEKAREKKINNNEASVRAIIEDHCILSKRFKGIEKYILKEKGTGLYKAICYDQLKMIENIDVDDTFVYEQLIKKIGNHELEAKITENVGQEDLILKEGPLKIIKYRRTGVKKQRSSKPDYIAEEIIKSKQGIINEKAIFEQEQRRLIDEDAEEQAKEMEEFFKNKKENEGFDILTFEVNENGEYIKKYIEVKSTKGNEGTPIDITSDEIEFAREHIDDYYLYRIVNSNTMHKRYLKIVKGKDLLSDYNFVPTSFKIYSK